MNYYKAYEIAEMPYIIWNGIGNFVTPEAFADSDYGDDPLVKAEVDIVLEFGVYAERIVAGELVPWNATEINNFRDAYNIKRGVAGEALRIGSINSNSFTYDSKEFPMDEVSRLFYTSIEKVSPSSSKIRTMENTAYDLDAADIAAFMAAYYAKLLLITKHTL